MSARKGRWVGPLHFTTCRQVVSAPRVDGCCCTVSEIDERTDGETERSYARGYAIRYRGGEAFVVGVRSDRFGCPMGPTVWLRVKWRTLLWTLKGRPEVPPMAVGGECSTVAGPQR